MAIMNIKRLIECIYCGGTGVEVHSEYDSVCWAIEEVVGTCSGCNGRGWRIRDIGKNTMYWLRVFWLRLRGEENILF